MSADALFYPSTPITAAVLLRGCLGGVPCLWHFAQPSMFGAGFPAMFEHANISRDLDSQLNIDLTDWSSAPLQTDCFYHEHGGSHTEIHPGGSADLQYIHGLTVYVSVLVLPACAVTHLSEGSSYDRKSSRSRHTSVRPLSTANGPERAARMSRWQRAPTCLMLNFTTYALRRPRKSREHYCCI